MFRSFFSYEEQEEYDKGRNDQRFNHHDMSHDSDNEIDKAYWMGRNDFGNEQAEREREERLMEEQREYHDYMEHLEEASLREYEEHLYYMEHNQPTQDYLDMYCKSIQDEHDFFEDFKNNN